MEIAVHHQKSACGPQVVPVVVNKYYVINNFNNDRY